ncbi:MAG: hypothetical protein HY718_08470 [Planctomycetes bacterium]|nr:hypothetical protein [Planctomycetota bacterium]
MSKASIAFVVVLVGLTTGGSCGPAPEANLPIPDAGDNAQLVPTPPTAGSDIPAGTYAGDVTLTVTLRENGSVVSQSTTFTTTAIFNDRGQELSPVDGTPVAAGYGGVITLGDLTASKTITSVVYVSDSVTVGGTVNIDIHSQPGRPAVGAFSFTFRLRPSGRLDFDEIIAAATSPSSQWPDVISFELVYSGVLTNPFNEPSVSLPTKPVECSFLSDAEWSLVWKDGLDHRDSVPMAEAAANLVASYQRGEITQEQYQCFITATDLLYP